MSDTRPDSKTLQAVLRELIPDTDQIDDVTMERLISGEDVRYDKDEFSASLDLTELFKQVHEWVPIVANLFTIAKVLYDVSARAKASPPTADEIADAFMKKTSNNQISRRELDDAAQLVAARLQRNGSRG
jgi:hypothetical protein